MIRRFLAAVSTFFTDIAVAFDPSPELDVISLDQMYRELHFDLWEKELT